MGRDPAGDDDAAAAFRRDIHDSSTCNGAGAAAQRRSDRSATSRFECVVGRLVSEGTSSSSSSSSSAAAGLVETVFAGLDPAEHQFLDSEALLRCVEQVAGTCGCALASE